MIFNKVYGVLGGCVQLAFPNSEYLPAECLQLSLLVSVPLDCPAKFLGPEVGARLRHRRIGTPFMAVPEAPVNEDDRAGSCGRTMSGFPGRPGACSRKRKPLRWRRLRRRISGFVSLPRIWDMFQLRRSFEIRSVTHPRLSSDQERPR